eukprot:g6339.t1
MYAELAMSGLLEEQHVKRLTNAYVAEPASVPWPAISKMKECWRHSELSATLEVFKSMIKWTKSSLGREHLIFAGLTGMDGKPMTEVKFSEIQQLARGVKQDVLPYSSKSNFDPQAAPTKHAEKMSRNYLFSEVIVILLYVLTPLWQADPLTAQVNFASFISRIMAQGLHKHFTDYDKRRSKTHAVLLLADRFMTRLLPNTTVDMLISLIGDWAKDVYPVERDPNQKEKKGEKGKNPGDRSQWDSPYYKGSGKYGKGNTKGGGKYGKKPGDKGSKYDWNNKNSGKYGGKYDHHYQYQQSYQHDQVGKGEYDRNYIDPQNPPGGKDQETKGGGKKGAGKGLTSLQLAALPEVAKKAKKEYGEALKMYNDKKSCPVHGAGIYKILGKKDKKVLSCRKGSDCEWDHAFTEQYCTPCDDEPKDANA